MRNSEISLHARLDGGTAVVVDAIGSTSSGLVAADGDILLIIVVDVEAKTGRVNAAVAPDEESAEDGLGEEVEDTVEDGLGVGGDDIATLAETPGDWVEEPEEGGERAADEEGAADILAHGVGVLAGLEGEHVRDVEEGGAAESVVAPLVASVDEGADETSHDHDLVNEDGEEDGRPGHGGSEKQVHEQQWGGDRPIDVANVEDLTVIAAHDRVVAEELDLDRDEAKVAGHCEVSDGGNHGNSGRDVVEDALLARLRLRQTGEDESRDSHACADCPVPVGAADGNGNVGSNAIDGVACTRLLESTHQ